MHIPARTQAPTPTPTPAPIPCATPHESPAQVWAELIAAAGDNDRLSAQLEKLELVSLSPQRAVLGHAPRNKIAAELALAHVQPLLARVLGHPVAVLLQPLPTTEHPRLVRAPLPLGEQADASTTTPAPSPLSPSPPALDRAALDAEAQNPLVIHAMQALGATIRTIRPRAD
ncbi:MAG: hypothetical protein ACK54T_11085 [bacterium]